MTNTVAPTISFLGAAETVTGSRYLVESPSSKILVDCGLFQGYKKLRERNWNDPGFSAATVDAVVLTHAHLDHSGYLPRLMNAGFQGPVYCTPGTRDLLRILLPDAGHLQEEEAKLAAKLGYSKHRSPLPLFTREDAERALSLLQPRDFGERFSLTAGVSGCFSRAGHIVGSACLRLQLPSTSVGFSGDVGRPRDSLLLPPAPLPPCHNLVVESTYGDRLHPSSSAVEQLAKVVLSTVARGGALVVPAFAVGRAQHVLYLLSLLLRARSIPPLPIFLDSPMAIDATAIFRNHPEEHSLSPEECREMCAAARYASSAEDSKAIDATDGPQVIISASGMATGGRVLHHLSRFLPDARNTVLLVGYQSSGTRGRALLDGVQELKIHGRYVPVRAQVATIEGLSAHADYRELTEWLSASKSSPEQVFVTHGEPAAADAMRRQLADRLGWQAIVPAQGERLPLFVPRS